MMSRAQWFLMSLPMMGDYRVSPSVLGASVGVVVRSLLDRFPNNPCLPRRFLSLAVLW